MFCRNSKGSVFIYVLFLLTAISAIVLKYNKEIKQFALIKHNIFQKEIGKIELENLATLIGIGYFSNDVELQGFKESFDNLTTINYKGNSYKVLIKKESELKNINTTDRAALVNDLYDSIGEQNDELIDELADSILDFIDSDDLVRTKGAESNQYHYNNLPYNRKLDFIDDAKLIKGVSEEVFFKNELDNNSNYIGIFANFTTFKSSANIYSVVDNKYNVYKDIIRVYISTFDNKIYCFFVGRNGKYIESFHNIRLL